MPVMGSFSPSAIWTCEVLSSGSTCSKLFEDYIIWWDAPESRYYTEDDFSVLPERPIAEIVAWIIWPFSCVGDVDWVRHRNWRSWGWCKGIFQWCSMIGLNFPILWIWVVLRNQIASPFEITAEFLLALISLMLKFLARLTLNFAHILRARFTFGGMGGFKITCLLI